MGLLKTQKMLKKNAYQDPYEKIIDLEEFDEDFDPKGSQDSKNTPSTFKRRNKYWGVYLLVMVAGCIVFLFGYFSVLGQINLPFTNRGDVDSQEIDSQEAAALFLDLQTADTDEDGLSDYEELYLYATSPYLPDSDSDGINDDQEMSEGTDPNCPKGQICGRVTNSNTNSQTDTNTGADTNTNQSTTLASGQISIENLRSALKRSGASANAVDSMDDATLWKAYSDLVAGQEPSLSNINVNSGDLNDAVSPGPNQTISLSNLEDLSASEIRSLLRLGGIDENSLNKMDDQTLKMIFQNSLQQYE